jgi:predicted Fe-Mo cluster-binding NifX family protein
MKLLIPTENDLGLSAQAADHFGRAPYFTLVDTETGDVRTFRNAAAGHGHAHGHGGGVCRILDQTDLPPFDAIVCREIGRGALTALQEDGIRVWTSREYRVSEIANAVKGGSATPLSPADVCSGEGEGRGPHHDHRHRLPR